MPLRIPVLGAIPRDETLVLPERHLGLVQASEHADLAARLARFAEMAARHLDLDAILAMAAPLASAAIAPARAEATRPTDRAGVGRRPFLSSMPTCSMAGGAPARRSCRSRRCVTSRQRTIAMSAGCRAVIRNCTPANWRRRAIFGMACRNSRRPCAVHGECGGYMVLGEGLEDAQGVRHAMAGLLGHATSFAKRKLHLGYRQARLLADNPIGAVGDVVRGHEFHHASIIAKGNDEPFVDVTDAQGRPVTETGSRRGRVSGTFFHAIAREA